MHSCLVRHQIPAETQCSYAKAEGTCSFSFTHVPKIIVQGQYLGHQWVETSFSRKAKGTCSFSFTHIIIVQGQYLGHQWVETSFSQKAKTVVVLSKYSPL